MGGVWPGKGQLCCVDLHCDAAAEAPDTVKELQPGELLDLWS